MNRAELTHHLVNLQFEQSSNIKFYKLLWSRLQEEGLKSEIRISSDDANKIASVVDYDFSNVPEDNDSLSEFATEYASYAYKVYKAIKLNGIRDITPLLKYFKIDKLEISSL